MSKMSGYIHKYYICKKAKEVLLSEVFLQLYLFNSRYFDSLLIGLVGSRARARARIICVREIYFTRSRFLLLTRLLLMFRASCNIIDRTRFWRESRRHFSSSCRKYPPSISLTTVASTDASSLAFSTVKAGM